MSLCDSTFDLKINIGQHDLHFTVQWFCLISWRLSDCWMSYFRIMSKCDVTFDPIIKVGVNDLYFMNGPVILFYSLRVFHGWMSYFTTMNQCDAIIDVIINKGQHDSSVILAYILNSNLFDWNVIVSYNELLWWDDWLNNKWRSQRPIFYGLILPHYAPLKSNDVCFLVFMHTNNFRFIGKAWFRQATLSCDSSYYIQPSVLTIFHSF